MGIYEGRLTRAEIRRAGENGEYLSQRGRKRGGVLFLATKWTTFDSDEVDMQSILKATDKVPKPDEPFKGTPEDGELEVKLVDGKAYVPPPPPGPIPGVVADRPSDEEMKKAREEELAKRKRGRPKKKKEA